jgi:hypothetical protein
MGADAMRSMTMLLSLAIVCLGSAICQIEMTLCYMMGSFLVFVFIRLNPGVFRLCRKGIAV